MALCSCKKALFFFAFVILALSILIYSQIEHEYQVIELPKDSHAVCLDGSPYRFQLQRGSGNGSNSFLFYFEPGGFCGDNGINDETIASCLKKQGTFLGSNKFSFINRYFFSYFSRLLSSQQRHNKHFFNWNKIFVRYCDGAIFAGNSHIKTEHGTDIYSVGEMNVKGVVEYLKQQNAFSKAKNIILTGSSAGALASFFWANYFEAEFPQAIVSVLSDSGFFLDFASPYRERRYLFREMMTNLTRKLDVPYSPFIQSYCSIDRKEDLWKCFIPKYIIGNIKPSIRILIVHSLFDSWVMKHLVGSACFHNTIKVLDSCSDQELAHFEEHSVRMIEELDEASKRRGNVTAWLSKGSFHAPLYFGWIWESEIYKVNGISLSDMIDQWYTDNSTVSGKIVYEAKVKKRLKDIAWVMHYSVFLNNLI